MQQNDIATDRQSAADAQSTAEIGPAAPSVRRDPVMEHLVHALLPAGLADEMLRGFYNDALQVSSVKRLGPGDLARAGGLSRMRITRRSTLAMAVAASGTQWLSSHARADVAVADAIATVRMLNTALLACMKTGRSVAFSSRYAAMEPAIDQTFDLPTVLAVSVGVRWAGLPPDQQNRLLTAFRRYTVASYVANFDSYSGQSFAISSDTRDAGNGRMIVESRIVPVSGEATKFGYVTMQTPSGWKIVDVLEDGSISRVAVQRSDFRAVLASGGATALLEKLARKAADLSGGALV